MIWNPWKEIAKLREKLELYVEMAFEEGQKVSFLQTNKEVLQGRIASLEADIKSILLNHTDRLDGYKQLLSSTTESRSELIDVLRSIAAMETPRCSNVVRKITRMAREALGDQLV
jgi:DNA repair exonuclease SbcCD ATPase subunit